MSESESTDDCGCAPTPRELRELREPSLRSPLSRRTALGLGGLGILGLSALGMGFGSAAFADNYPSWDDVQRAKNNEAAKADEISRIEGLIANLEADVANKQAEAARLADEYAAAQEAYETAAAKAVSLQEQADAEEQRATETAQKLGRLAAQQYRSGGDDAALELFFSGSAATADELLSRLGTMDRLVEANQSTYADAVSARNNAQSLSDQASVARDERDRLQKEAEQKMMAAQQAAVAAQAALDEQNANRDTLEAQLAALKDTTSKTIADYQAGVEARRKAEEERQRQLELERQRQAEEARKRDEERRAQEAANNNNGGGGGGGGGGGSSSGGSSSGGTGGTPGTGGWVRPASGGITSWYGNRGTICGNGYCTTGHQGIDFGAGCWSPIYAASAGQVIIAQGLSSWGNCVRIRHSDGTVTAYAHIVNGGFNVSVGQWVSAGQVIAYVGNTGASTGCHLHFEVWNGSLRIDPAPFLRARGISL